QFALFAPVMCSPSAFQSGAHARKTQMKTIAVIFCFICEPDEIIKRATPGSRAILYFTMLPVKSGGFLGHHECTCIFQNDIRKEIERRKMGKQNQEFKRKQDAEKAKQILEERNREKAEEKAARERVKQQIAMDRAERAATYARLQQDEKVAKQNLLQAKQADQDARKELQIRERSTISRIQFRLPDGSSLTNQFPSQTRLQEAWNFAFEEIGSLYGNFSLATMYPRQEFTSEDLNKTLLELKLVPSASIVLLPVSSPESTLYIFYVHKTCFNVFLVSFELTPCIEHDAAFSDAANASISSTNMATLNKNSLSLVKV
uniref:UBX domain-containing protein 4 n=1 Tax=Fundulus heteroclitus TaxID=8078 RepID=A0A3Q2QCY3_FUNHE